MTMCFPRRAAVAFFLIAAGPAHACLVCIPMPERTLADHVVEAAAVALARNDPDDPFRYAVTEYLKGDAAGAPGEIPFLVDSTTRGRMAADAGVFAIVSRELPESEWVLHATGGARMVSVVREIAARAEDWLGHAGTEDRFAYFAELHDSPEPGVRSLALAEISGARYGLIRTLAPRLSRAEVIRVLRDPTMFEWAPIHILLLGLSDDPADRAFVRSAFEAAGRSTAATTLGAWTTAYLEVDGTAALARVRATYIDDPARPEAQMLEIVRALSTFSAVAEPALREEVVEHLGLLATARPGIAAEAAGELSLAGDWSLAPLFEDLLATGAISAPEDEFAVTLHLSFARDAGALSTGEDPVAGFLEPRPSDGRSSSP
jgi:hypothetical protein